MVDVERGQFYIGGDIDPSSGDRTGAARLYDAHDLTTHGVIVGMTGSGKTGLGIILLEEALLSGIPALIIDPKGDMGNLLLNFPKFRPEDFRPWIDEGEAQRKGVTPDEFAAVTADLWKNGLGKWEIGSDRLTQLGLGAEFAIYTPGSGAGIPMNIVGSLAAPDLDWQTEAETGRDEIEGFVSSLLVLAGIEADPISSREHILLSNIIEKAWRAGMDLDLAQLIAQVQDPPIRKLGVFEVDTFFPPKDRTALAMRLNGLVASPSFSAWMEGPSVDIQSLLFSQDGKPRAAVVYLQHLGEKERQFIVTLLLSKMVTWLRRQPGTSDLRALIYMDEVFGFAPPTAEPPSKKPILTIFKQARAHGVGMVLSTQNPVDLDYKAMSNAGTWLIGRLQTERDKARILEALKSASGAVDVARFDKLIGDLDKRQFVLHTTRSSEPAVMTTRWAMSYLRGPLTREEVTRLSEDAPERQAVQTAAPTETARGEVAEDEPVVAQKAAPAVSVYHLDAAAPWGAAIGAVAGGKRHQAGLVARLNLVYDDQYAKINHREEWEAVFFPLGSGFDPADHVAVDYDGRDLRPGPPADGTFVLTEAPIDSAAFFKQAEADLKEWLYRNQKAEVFKNEQLKLYSRIGETAEEFAARCDEAADNAADAEVAALHDRYKVKIDRVKDQLAAAERRARELETDTQSRRQQELVGGAGDLLSVFLGGKRRSRSLSGVASRRSQTVRTQERLRSAQVTLSEKVSAIDDLEDDLSRDLTEITDRWNDAARDVQIIEIGLEKTDMAVDELALVWVPTA
ncbi:MAG: ATP-binding protein [Acidimicrobiia bacterium]